MFKKMTSAVLLMLAFAHTCALADELVGLSDVTAVGGAIISLRYEGVEYVVEDGDLVLGTTTRWYIQGGVETLWEEGTPTPAATVTGTSTVKAGDVGSKADNFNFTDGGTNISSIDGIDFQQTVFPSLSKVFFHFERGGNDTGTWQAIYANGSLGTPVQFTASNVYADTGVNVNGQNAFGVVFLTDAPAIGVRITASGHDTFSISIPAPEQTLAVYPSPEDESTDVIRDVDLGWTPGISAQTHNVYLGSSWDDVNNASLTEPMGAEITEGLDVNSLLVENLDFGQTYFWRVDEVNGAPDRTVFKGTVWSFTVEPFAYPVQPIAATASSSHEANMGPEKTIDGSGLNDLDQHANVGTDMWLSGAGAAPAWIQYELDKAYKLDEMWVWNSNQLIESFVGLGFKGVTVETSLDGQAWTVVENATEFAQATGASDYAANTIVNFNGAMATFVRITLNSGWGMTPQNGLSEVRIFHIPIQAREPQPADGAVDVAPDAVLTWRTGREAAGHEVVLSDDEQAVIDNTAVLDAATETSFDLSTAGIELGTTYYWKVNEINEAATPSSVAGEVWSFSTREFTVVDGFESYDDDCRRIFFNWQDGFGHNGSEECAVPPYNGNGSGSIVGNANAPFAEQTIVHSGDQSMPLEYESSSEAQLALNQDWTLGGAQTLVLYFYGDPGNTGNLFVKVNGSKVAYDGPADAITTPYWTQWNIDLVSLGANLQSVTQLSVGAEGGSGIVYIDDIRLYREAPAPANEQLWIEAESAAIAAPMQAYSDKTDATGGSYIGTDDFGNLGDQSDGVASFTFTVQGGIYKVNARVIAQDAGDSFWIRLPGATLNTTPPAANNGWIRYNGIPHGDDWHWDDIHNDQDGSIPVHFTLDAGTHTLEIAWREDGALLDAIVITDQL